MIGCETVGMPASIAAAGIGDEEVLESCGVIRVDMSLIGSLGCATSVVDDASEVDDVDDAVSFLFNNDGSIEVDADSGLLPVADMNGPIAPSITI